MHEDFEIEIIDDSDSEDLPKVRDAKHPSVRLRRTPTNKTRKEINKRYRAKNKDLLREKSKEYRAKNKVLLREKSKEYYDKNKDLCREKRKEYYAKNKEKFHYQPHPRNYANVNFKLPKSGYRNIRQTPYDTYEVILKSNKKKYYKTVKSLEDAIVLAEKMRNELFFPK